MQKFPASILIVDDDQDVLTTARIVLRQKYASVEMENNPKKLNYLLQHKRYDVILLDMNYAQGTITGNEGLFWLKQILSINPHTQVILITAYGDIKIAVESMKLGAADFIVKPWENEKLEATVHAAYQHALSKREITSLKNKQTQYSRVLSSPDTELIGNAPAMQHVISTIEKVAATDANILLLGENGTGKELIAKYIHAQSLRKNEPFIKVDVGSLSANLFESELFGHKKGAFTDARDDRTGRIELAHNGTLFLDEIGNVPLPYQSKLLSVLQNREVTPIGSNNPISFNVRLICATNLEIHDAAHKGLFREDLLYRINTVELTLPPLRDRIEDIPLLAHHFVKMYSNKYRKEKYLPEDTVRHLQKYNWPGNVRELQHAVERAVIMSDQASISRHHFLLTSKKDAFEKKDILNLEEMEKKTIVSAIRKYQGNMSKVAKELGLGRTTLYRKLTKYGLPFGR